MQKREFPVDQEVINIGADSQNDLRIQDDYVSGSHARLRYENGGLLVSDLGSRNGTFVNGQRVSETARAIMPGDRIRIGETTFEVHPA